MSLSYRLVVLTHGDSATLEECLESFAANVAPLPSELHIVRDGAASSPPVGYVPDWPCQIHLHQVAPRQAGFCRATGYCWGLGAAARAPYVFHLEHDFVFERRVSLEQMASLLDGDDRLAQVALVRNAVNRQELAAGGLIESRPSSFHRRRSVVEAEGVGWTVEWLDHRAFFTTNPSLMRQAFMAENPWIDDDEPYCEGRFGIDLVARDYHFAYWGDGVPYVRHVGARDGVGRGY